MRSRKPEPGYANQSADPFKPALVPIPMPDPTFADSCERDYYQQAVEDRKPGEDVIVWLERVEAGRARATLGPGSEG